MLLQLGQAYKAIGRQVCKFFLGTSQKVEGPLTVLPSILNICFDFSLCQIICLFFVFPFPSDIDPVIRNESSLHVEMRSCAPFLLLFSSKFSDK